MKKLLLSFILITVVSCLSASAQQFRSGGLSRYQGEAYTGWGFSLDDHSDSKFYAETIHGIRFSEKLFAGLGFGYNSSVYTSDYFQQTYWDSYLSVLANFKYYIPLNNSMVSVFASFSGGYILSLDYIEDDGYTLHPAIGVSLKPGRGSSAINFSVGYDYQYWGENSFSHNSGNNTLSVKLGYQF